MNNIVNISGLKIRERRNELGITQEELGRKIGVSRNTINNYEKGNIIPDSKQEILNKILFGSDDVQEKDTPYLVTSSGTKYYKLANNLFKMIVPFIPICAYAGYVDEYRDAEFIERLEEREFYVKEIHHGEYYSFEIKGDSMDDGSRDSLINGDVVLARNLDRSHWRGLRYKEVKAWIIVLKNTIVCKRIIDVDLKNGIFKCHSLNSSPEYADFDIKFDETVQIMNIVKRESDY